MPETIGQQLRQVREARNLTFEKVVEATHIRARNLQALEADDFESLASPVQARAFLKMYAEFLDLKVDDLIARQRESAVESKEDLRDEHADSMSALGLATEINGSIPASPSDETPPSPSADVPASHGNKPAGFFARLAKPRSKAKPQPPVDTLQDEYPIQANPPESVIQAENGHTSVESLTASSTASQAIFSAIGADLRKRRESISLTLEEIERHTHVRKHYLQALEAGDFDHLPSSVQTRGMLNNYAHFLDMDVDGLLLKFAEGLQAQRLERQPGPDQKEQEPASKTSQKISLPPSFRRYLSMDILVGGSLVVLLLGFTIWGASRIVSMRSVSTIEPTAPSISNILAGSPQAVTSTATLANQPGAGTSLPVAADTLGATLPTAGPGAVQVVVVAQQDAWVRVTVDKKIQFMGRVTPGTSYSYSGNSQIEVLTGNGSALSILYNQSDLGSMGTVGEVVDRIYTATAILGPTATFTPSPTITPIPSISPRPSITPRFSLTPRSSPTPTH